MDSRRTVIPEASVITDFAITSVNVPDRLDAQEVRARAEEEQDSTRFHARNSWALRRWLIGLGAAAAIVVAMFAVFKVLSPLWTQVSADGVADQLRQALGRHVTVANAGLRLAPTPRLVIEGIDVSEQFRIESVALRFSWSSLAKAIQGAGWVWGEATVGPLELSPESAFALIQAAPALSRVVPAPITSVRFESVRVNGSGILPARYEVLASRSSGRPFTELSVVDLDARDRMELAIVLSPSENPRFRLRGLQWRPPLGPALEWNQVAAEGSFALGRLQVDSFSANGFLGVVVGTLTASRSAGWRVRGTVQSTNIDLTALQREARRGAKLPAGPALTPVVQGVMESAGTLSGQGDTLSDALARTSSTSRVTIKFAALNGANLGAGVVQAGTSGLGGATRFGEVEATVDVGPGVLRIRDILGSAGALKVRGAVGVERDLALGGILRAEVSSAGGLATADVRVSGTVFEPIFEY